MAGTTNLNNDCNYKLTKRLGSALFRECERSTKNCAREAQRMIDNINSVLKGEKIMEENVPAGSGGRCTNSVSARICIHLQFLARNKCHITY